MKRVPGVQEAKFSYSGGEGWVTFDTRLTSPQEFLDELSTMTDFRGTVRERVSIDDVPSDDALEDRPVVVDMGAEHDTADALDPMGPDDSR